MRSVAARAGDRLDASRRVLWLSAFAPTLVLYVATMRTNPFDMSSDPTAVSPSAWSVAHHGTPLLRATSWPRWNPWVIDLVHGQAVSNRPPGLLFLAAPAYRLFGAVPSFSPLPGSLTAAGVTAAAMATLALALTHVLTHRAALVAALIAATATTTWAVSGTALFPQGPDQLAIAVALWALAANRYGRAGVAYAVAMTVRPTLAIAAAANGIIAAWKQRRVAPLLFVGGATAVGAAAYWAYLVSLPSSPATRSSTDTVALGTHGYVGSLFDVGPAAWPDLAEKIAGTLVSPGRGILVGSPFLLMLLPGLVRAWRSAPTWVRSSAVGAAAYELVQLKCEVFTGGVFFWSYRYPIEPLTLCAPLLALCWTQWTSLRAGRRAVFGGLVVVSVTWQAVGALFFRGPYADRPWTFDNARGALTHGHPVAAPVLLATGFAAAACVTVLLYRTRLTLTVAQMLDVSGADRMHPVGGVDDHPTEIIDVARPSFEDAAVTQRHPDVGAQGAAHRAVGIGQAARRSVTVRR